MIRARQGLVSWDSLSSALLPHAVSAPRSGAHLVSPPPHPPQPLPVLDTCLIHLQLIQGTHLKCIQQAQDQCILIFLSELIKTCDCFIAAFSLSSILSFLKKNFCNYIAMFAFQGTFVYIIPVDPQKTFCSRCSMIIFVL